LILSAGTQKSLDRRKHIADRLKDILLNGDPALGKLAFAIDDTWRRMIENVSASGAEDQREQRGRLGWIPDPECSLYAVIAADVATFLEAELDPLEILDLLAHLIGFHLTLYIYHRAHPKAIPESHVNGSC